MKVQRLRYGFRKLANHLLLILCFFISKSVFGQEITIVNNENDPLIGVFVYSSDNKFQATSDENGQLIIPENTVFPIFLNYLGYKDQQLTLLDLQKENFHITLLQDDLLMEEIVLIGRTDIAREDLAYATSTIQAKDIELNAPQTSADALQANAGVFIQKSQLGGGSPVVRGFEANKLLLVVDGVRLNNTIYRSGHLQNAITIDPAILGSLEVIFGPGSLMYGSDALGGVVHFKSKEIQLEQTANKPFDIGYYTRYGSSNNERTAHVDFMYSGKRWGSLTSVTLTDFNDLRIGANRADKYEDDYGLRPWYVEQGNENADDLLVENENPLILRSTGYTQFDFLQKFKFKVSDQLSFSWNNQFSTSSNIPRYDALTEFRNNSPRFSQWDYGPQQRVLSSLTTKYIPTESVLFDKIQWIIAYQNIREIRITSFFESDEINEQNELLNILNTTLDFSKKNGAHQIYYGLDGNFNDLNSRAFQQNYGLDNRALGGLTRYPNDLGRAFSSGAYAQYYYLPDSWYKINIGARYDYNQVDIRFERDNFFEWPEFFYEGITNRNNSVNGSVGFHADLPSGFKLRTLVGTSFRSPNIDDIAKTRLNNDEISIPNSDLIPEKSLSSEATIAYRKAGLEVSVTGFHTILQDAVVRENFALPSGETIFITNNDTFNIVANVNAENGFIQGFSMNSSYSFRKNFEVEGSVNFMRGQVINEGEAARPLGHIPPTYGRLFFSYEKGAWQLRTGSRFNAFKPIDSFGGSVDNPEFATARGSESWYTLHATAAYKFHSALTLQVGVDNILDQFYVPFASGLPGAGRHVSVTIRGHFGYAQ